MKYLLLLLLSLSAHAFSPVKEEALYRNFYREFFELPGFSVFPKNEEQKLALDAIEDALENGAPSLKLRQWFTPEQVSSLGAHEQIRLFRLKAARGLATPNEELLALSGAKQRMDNFVMSELSRIRPFLKSPAAQQMLAEMPVPVKAAKRFVAPGVAEVKALFSQPPAFDTFLDGRYAATPRIFVFCRHDHNYPCLLAMRDAHNEVVRENGKIWLQPALGLSNRGLPFDQRNGNTPQGAQLVDGVMPEADMPFYYGRFRRLILTFAPASKNEAEQKKLFPASSHNSDWWREAVIARDLGRNLLRIHGVGEISKETGKPYYPFIPTIGCLAQREGKYGAADYTDQRKLLDRWMNAMGLEAKFENEPLIRGIMYVIEIDDKKSAVNAEDLKLFGIR
ncbi:MAG: hypothetical protein AB7K68_10320 [Bacteriovoracia bacterium]